MTNNILKIIPTIQSASLLKSISKKKKKRSIVNDATKIIVGSSLIKIESDFLGGV